MGRLIASALLLTLVVAGCQDDDVEDRLRARLEQAQDRIATLQEENDQPREEGVDEERYADLYGGGPTISGTVLALPRLGTLTWRCDGKRRFRLSFQPGPATISAAYSLNGDPQAKRTLDPGQKLQTKPVPEETIIAWTIRHRHKPGLIVARISATAATSKFGQCLLSEVRLSETARVFE